MPKPADDPAVAVMLKRAAARYDDAERYARIYVSMKLRQDPVHTDILALAMRERFGRVLDIGCGRGQLAVALLEAGLAESVIGLDRDRAHLAQAAHAARDLAFTPELQDLGGTLTLPEADTVVMVDVLYQLDTEAQLALLAAIAAAARWRVLIRTLDPNAGLRSLVTRGVEKLGRRFMPHSGPRVNPMPITEIAAVFTGAGFDVARAPCWRGTPFANVLVVARKRPRPVTPGAAPPAGAGP